MKEVLDKDVNVLKPKLDALKSTVNEITTELYKNAQPPPGTQQGGTDSQETTSGGEKEQTTGEQKTESSSNQETKNK